MRTTPDRRPREGGASDLAKASIDRAEGQGLIPHVGGADDDTFLDTFQGRDRDYRAQQVPPPNERRPFTLTR